MSGTTSLNGTVIVVGGGQAGAEASTRLRQQGFLGRILLLGEEPHPPYTRPPLSKAFLSGEVAREALLAKAPVSYEKAGVELRLGTRVQAIDRHTRSIALQDGESLPYDTLVLATGGRPRILKVPGHTLRNIFSLRGIDDVEAMRDAFRPGRRLVIVGGGYVGLEVAAVAVKAGLSVTVLEGASRVLARVTAPEMSSFYERVHREQGVQIRTGVVVSAFIEADDDPGAVGGVECGEGEPVPADFVIVGIGLIPNAELAEDAGLVVDGGIVVEPDGRTADPHIYAIGDCATYAHHGFLSRKLRVESVPNAIEQAHACAAAICGKPVAKATPPWFWSDQYELKLQMVGISDGYDETVVRGSPDSASFATFYLAGGQVIAADAVNRPGDFMAAKRMVAEHMHVAASALADEAVTLRQTMSAIAAPAA